MACPSLTGGARQTIEPLDSVALTIPTASIPSIIVVTIHATRLPVFLIAAKKLNQRFLFAFRQIFKQFQ